MIIRITMISLLLFCLAGSTAYSRDDGRYANSPLKGWFDKLRSGKGPCCSDADGSVVKDSDWVSVNDPARPTVQYRVMIEGEWHDVEDSAVIKEPNLFGRTMVWPFYERSYMAPSARIIIRCFMPGPMT